MNRFAFVLSPKSEKSDLQKRYGVHHSRIMAQLAESDEARMFRAPAQAELHAPNLISVDRIQEIANDLDLPRETASEFVRQLVFYKRQCDERLGET